jgi:hypothetical protein
VKLGSKKKGAWGRKNTKKSKKKIKKKTPQQKKYGEEPIPDVCPQRRGRQTKYNWGGERGGNSTQVLDCGYVPKKKNYFDSTIKKKNATLLTAL